MSRTLPFYALALVAVSSCAGGMTKRDEMMFAVREFNDGVRWGKIDASAAHLPIEARQKFAERYTGLEEELEVVDYELVRVDIAPGGKSAVVRVDVSWSLRRRGIVEKTTVEQRWEELGGWVLTRETKLRGAPLPIFEISGNVGTAGTAASALPGGPAASSAQTSDSAAARGAATDPAVNSVSETPRR